MPGSRRAPLETQSLLRRMSSTERRFGGVLGTCAGVPNQMVPTTSSPGENAKRGVGKGGALDVLVLVICLRALRTKRNGARKEEGDIGGARDGGGASMLAERDTRGKTNSGLGVYVSTSV